jgi:ribosomal subunit interface protein
MKVNIKATNMELLPAVVAQVQEKIGSLDRYFNNIQQIDVEVGLTTKGQQKGNIYFCEVNVAVPKKLIRFRREMDDLTKAINEVKKGIQNELKEYKEIMQEVA